MFKSYFKWKFIALVQKKLMYYSNEKNLYLLRAEEWKLKIDNGNRRFCQESFEEIKKRQISWSYEKYREFYHKEIAAEEILKIIENI